MRRWHGVVLAALGGALAGLWGCGELCGLLFDGTYDTVASDILYDPVRTRSINVDSRYLFWVLTEVDGATRVLEELGK